MWKINLKGHGSSEPITTAQAKINEAEGGSTRPNETPKPWSESQKQASRRTQHKLNEAQGDPTRAQESTGRKTERPQLERDQPER